MSGNTEFKTNVKMLSPAFIYAKVLFFNTLVYTLSFLLGVLLFHAFVPEEVGFDRDISNFLSADFSECGTVFDYVNTILRISKSELSQLTALFFAGFTMVSGIIVLATFVFRGFSIGFAFSYLVFLINNGLVDFKFPKLALGIYTVLCVVNSAVLLDFSGKTMRFSDEFKKLCVRPKRIILSKIMYSHITCLFISLGAMILLNLIKCVL